MKRFVAFGLAALVLSLAACSGGKDKGGEISIDGSSTVAPVSKAVAEEFQKSKKGAIKVVVGTSGTGGGFKKFVRGEIDISDASRPIMEQEMKDAKEKGIEYIELPICYDALTVAVHPKNHWVKHLTVAQLKKIWEPEARGKVTKWSDINPNWPDRTLRLFGAGTDSGTWDYFTEAVVGKAKSCRNDFTASEDDNAIVTGIAGDEGALGFLPFSYYDQNRDKIKAVAIQWDKNKVKDPVLPSLEAVLEGTYNPLSRPLFIYVNKKSAERPEVKEFVEFYLKNATDLCKEVKYLPLPEKAYELAQERFNKMETGTAFGGVPEVGLPVEDLLKRSPKH